mmetsp:Transcript_15953/g.19476  ORF Transcript_15953/g.19476 Transcript_15953/m.19476 type:complete len:336 (-) Transcript_15953:1188-2195(-)
MSSAKEIFLQYVCPSMGTIMASAMFAAPITSLREALARGSLGSLNPTPWAFMTGNCLGWVAYSFITHNIFVLVSNLPGLILSVWLNMGAAKLQYMQKYDVIAQAQSDFDSSYSLTLEEVGDKDDNVNDQQQLAMDIQTNRCNDNIYMAGTMLFNDDDNHNHQQSRHINNLSSTKHEIWVIFILILWGFTLSLLVFLPVSQKQRADIVGIVVNLNLVVFYGSPLSTIVRVLQTRSSSSIHGKTLAMGLLNSFFWLAYGLALNDMIIFTPNGCGFFLSILQLILCLIFPRNNTDDNSDDEQLLSEQLVDEDMNSNISLADVAVNDYNDGSDHQNAKC